MHPALQLAQFRILKKDSQRAKFSFHLNGYSNVDQHCVSRRFWFAGNYWKLQVVKKNGHFGMYLRWYGTGRDDVKTDNYDGGDDDGNVVEEINNQFWCKASILFSVVNVIYRHASVTEGKRDEEEIFGKFRHGIGYGSIISLQELETTSGYVVDNTVYLQLQIRVYETGYNDLLWCVPTTKRGTTEGILFPFYGTTWRLIFFPHGESAEQLGSRTPEEIFRTDSDDESDEKNDKREDSENSTKNQDSENSTIDQNRSDNDSDKSSNKSDNDKNCDDIQNGNTNYEGVNDHDIDKEEDDGDSPENDDEKETDNISDPEDDGIKQINNEKDEKNVSNDDDVESSDNNGDEVEVQKVDDDGDDDTNDQDSGNNRSMKDDSKGDSDEAENSADENDGSNITEKLVSDPEDEREDTAEDGSSSEETSESKDSNSMSTSVKTSSIYLLRCGANWESELRYNVICRLSVSDPQQSNKEIVLNQHFYHKISNAYGTPVFVEMPLEHAFEKLKVSVSFEDVVPYYYFGIPLENLDENGTQQNDILVKDQFDYPWSFSLSPEDDKILCRLSLDPCNENSYIKSLIRRNKHMQVSWTAEMLSPIHIDDSVLFTCQSRRQIKDVVFSSKLREDVLEFSVDPTQLCEENNPLIDGEGMLSIRLSIYCCNYVASEHGQLLLSFNSMDQIVHEIRHTNPPLALGARTEKSRKVAVEETSQKKPSTSTSTATTSSGRIITTGVRTSEEDDVLIKSLVEHLDSYDRYIKHLEKNPKKAKAIHDYVSIASLIQNCRPTEHEYKHLSLVAKSLEKVLLTLPLDIEKILNIGALGQGTVVANYLGLDLVVYLRDYAAQKHRLNLILRVIKERIKEKASKDTTDRRLYRFKCEKRLPYVSNFYHTSNALFFKLGHVNTTIMLSQGFDQFNSHHDIYAKAAKAYKQQTHRYLVMLSYLQLAFVGKQPEKCKDLICVVKSWSNDIEWGSVDMRPSSYLLTLIVIHAFETVARSNVARTPSFDKEVLMKFGESVLDPKLSIEWNTYYKPSDYVTNSNSKKKPYIRDPAIPFHNVAKTGIGSWTQFRRETESWVESLTF